MLGVVCVPIATSFLMVPLEIWEALTMVTYASKTCVAMIVCPVFVWPIPLLPGERSTAPKLKSSNQVLWEGFEFSEIADVSEVAHEMASCNFKSSLPVRFRASDCLLGSNK